MDSELLFPDKEISKLKIDKVIKRDGRIVAFDKNRIIDSIFKAAVAVGGKDRLLAELLADKAAAIINNVYSLGTIPTVEEIQDIIEKLLVEEGHYQTAKAYILYRAEHTRIREKKDSVIVAEDNVPYKVLWRVFTWNVDHNCETIAKLNNHINNGTYPRLIVDAEKAYHDEVQKVADRISKGRKDTRLVIVAGPSSSGKTTTTIKISEKLKSYGLEFVVLGVDNYFKNLEHHPKDEYGDYDFESPDALDLDLINQHIYELLKGRKIQVPEYDFKTGKRGRNTVELKLNEGQVLLIDSLHGLYPPMTSSVPEDMKFKFYIEALCQIKDANSEFIRWSDLRMLRRMVRDSWHRSYNPQQTVGHWHYVRRSEKKYIVPYINKADYVFNGALAYELHLYKRYLFDSLKPIIQKYENDPKKFDAYIRAKRVYQILSETLDAPDQSFIPKNSLVREFIGGSIYKY